MFYTKVKGNVVKVFYESHKVKLKESSTDPESGYVFFSFRPSCTGFSAFGIQKLYLNQNTNPNQNPNLNSKIKEY